MIYDQDKAKEEIDNIKKFLDNVSDTSPDYINPEINDLKTRTFFWHSSIEGFMEYFISHRISKNIGFNNTFKEGEIAVQLEPILAELKFYKKVDICKNLEPAFPEVEAKDLNKLRNSLAHLRGGELRKMFPSQDLSKIRDAWVTVKDAKISVNKLVKDVLYPELGVKRGDDNISR